MDKFLLFCAFFSLVSCAQVTEKYPKDVADFLSNAEDCQHLSGEWDPSLPEVLKRDIKNQANATCSKAKAQLGALKTRYHAEKNILKKISKYDF